MAWAHCNSPVVVWGATGGHQACSLVCTGADSAGRYDAVALHVTVCKPLWTPHANGLALPRVAYLKGAKENSVALTS